MRTNRIVIVVVAATLALVGAFTVRQAVATSQVVAAGARVVTVSGAPDPYAQPPCPLTAAERLTLETVTRSDGVTYGATSSGPLGYEGGLTALLNCR